MDFKVKKMQNYSAAGDGDLVTIIPKKTSNNSGDSSVRCIKNYLTACWALILLLTLAMTILIAISYFHMICLRTQSEFFDSKNPQGSDVFYPEIVSFGCKVSYVTYVQNVAKMAKKNPNLTFNMFILFDDKILPKMESGKFFDSLFFHGQNYEIMKDKKLQTVLKENKNIIFKVALLSKYMHETPMRSKWRKFPISYLRFYTRAYAVWRSGGIALDLRSFCDPFLLPSKRNKKTVIMDFFNEVFQKTEKPSKFLIETNVTKDTMNATNNNVTATAVNKTSMENGIRDLLSPTLIVNHTKKLFFNDDTMFMDPFEMLTNMEIPLTVDFGFDKNNGISFSFEFSDTHTEMGENHSMYDLNQMLKQYPYFLSMDKRGSFIACGKKEHPFLEKILKNNPPCSFFGPEVIIEGIFTQYCNIGISDYCASLHFI